MRLNSWRNPTHGWVRVEWEGINPSPTEVLGHAVRSPFQRHRRGGVYPRPRVLAPIRRSFSPPATFSPQARSGHGEKKWLEEAIGRILCPEGRRPFIWAARHRAARAAYPETSPTGVGCGDRHPWSPYSALLRMGFTVPSPSPERRCALTAPFHPYPRPTRGRSALCGTFPRVTAAGRYPACLLSRSPDLPPGHTPQRTPASSSRAKDSTGRG